jgi:hypothetical protein
MTSPPLGPRSSVCALVPHFECHQWLADALESLLNQTRPLDAIVVIDDASSSSPVDIVERFPGVSLLVSADNGGPYRLIQTVIDATNFDAYMFQDADDWSAPERLELLLDAASRTGAELVGSHEVRIQVDAADVEYVRFPLDVNETMTASPIAHALLHSTSIVSRALVERVGGFATGMRFSGDSEFLRRAAHAGRVINVDHFTYFRRRRSGSLTTDPATALRSPARERVMEVLGDRARANKALVTAGEAPDLSPWNTVGAAQLSLVAGPPVGRDLNGQLGSRQSPVARRDLGHVPVFVIGAPRAGQALLACALGQSPSLRTLIESRWLTDGARAVLEFVDDQDERHGAEPAAVVLKASMSEALAALARDGGPEAWVAYGPHVTRDAWNLANVFETARFVFITSPAASTMESAKERAFQAWIDATRACLDLELALGAERVVRVEHRDMVDDADAVLRRVLEFANARYEPACRWVFDGMAVGADSGTTPGSARLSAEISELEARLVTQVPGVADPAAALRLTQQRRDRSDPLVEVPLVEDFRSLVSCSAPSNAVVAVISRGDPHLVDIEGVTGWHFPQADGGVYSGHHPLDSAEAVGHLEALRASGAEFLALPASAFWWLNHYDDFRRHLHRYRVVAYRESGGVVYALDDNHIAPSQSQIDITVDGRAPL